MASDCLHFVTDSESTFESLTNGVSRRHPQRERREDLDVKNAAGVVRGVVGVPAQCVRHTDLVEIAQALRDEDD